MEESARRAALADLYSLPGHLIWRSQARVASEVARLLPGRADLHAYAALVALAQVEPQSQQGLADMCGVSGTTMTSVADALERDGLVERVRNPSDRRSYALTRTTGGRAAVRRWEPDVRALEERLTAPLSPAEVGRLRRHLLTLVGDRLDERTPQALLDSVGFVVSRTHQHMHREFLTALEPLGIEPRHFGTLRALRAAGPVTQGQLGALLDVSPASVVQIVDHLERRGLVERRRSTEDRRAYRLHLRPASEVVLDDASRIAATVHDQKYGGPRSRGRTDLVRLLQKFLAGPTDR